MINTQYVKRRWSKVQIKVLKQGLKLITIKLSKSQSEKGKNNDDNDFKAKLAENILQLKCLLRYRQLQDIILALHSLLQMYDKNQTRLHIIPVFYKTNIKQQHQFENRVVLEFIKILVGLVTLNRNTSKHNKDLIANILAIQKPKFNNRLVGKLLVQEKQKLLQNRSQLAVSQSRKIKQLSINQKRIRIKIQKHPQQQKQTSNDHNQNLDQSNTSAQQSKLICENLIGKETIQDRNKREYLQQSNHEEMQEIQFEKVFNVTVKIRKKIEIIQLLQDDQKFEQPNLPILNRTFFQNLLQKTDDIDIQAQIDKWMVKIQDYSSNQLDSQDNQRINEKQKINEKSQQKIETIQKSKKQNHYNKKTT